MKGFIMGVKTDLLNELFDEWRLKLGVKNDKFSEDGIIEEDKWKQAHRKILFLLKETNDCPGDFRENCKKDPWPVLGYWAFGLQHVREHYVPPFTSAKEGYAESFRSSALVNLKKRPGKGSSEPVVIEQATRDDKDLIAEELQIIRPEVIVCGGTWPFVENALFDDSLGQFEHIEPDKERCYLRDGIIWIDHCHPSVPWRRDMAYYGLVSMYRNCLESMNKQWTE
jgi:hypothetical protein